MYNRNSIVNIDKSKWKKICCCKLFDLKPQGIRFQIKNIERSHKHIPKIMRNDIKSTVL